MSQNTIAPVPVTEKQYKAALKNWQRALKKRNDISAEKNEHVNRMSADYDKKIATQQACLDEALGVVLNYCNQNRAELFGDKQSITTEVGVVGYRKGTGALIKPEGMKPKELIEAMQRAKLNGFLKTVTSTTTSVVADKVKAAFENDSKEGKKVIAKLEAIGFGVDAKEKFYIDANV